jgi:C-terminal region of peptidase_M24
VALLSSNELKWLNDYNALVKNTLRGLVDAPTQGWLDLQCAPLSAMSGKRSASTSSSTAKGALPKKRLKA